MPAVVTGDRTCQVFSPTGEGDDCKYPMTTYTDECSSKVFIGGFGIVMKGDKVAPHNKIDCVPDESILSTYSSKVSVEGKPIARIGDSYGDNIIISGSGKVFAG